jgi:hypothetical protein
LRYTVQRSADNGTLSYEAFLRLLSDDSAFQHQLISALKGVPYEAFYWETPPINVNLLARSFEFVVTPTTTLAAAGVDADAFAKYFEKYHAAAVFPNLGRDSILVAPCDWATSSSGNLICAYQFSWCCRSSPTHASFFLNDRPGKVFAFWGVRAGWVR